MLKRITDHLRGSIFGALSMLVACAWLYLSTHEVKFTSTASNQSQAEQTASAIESLMPPLPTRKSNH